MCVAKGAHFSNCPEGRDRGERERGREGEREGGREGERERERESPINTHILPGHAPEVNVRTANKGGKKLQFLQPHTLRHLSRLHTIAFAWRKIPRPLRRFLFFAVLNEGGEGDTFSSLFCRPHLSPLLQIIKTSIDCSRRGSEARVSSSCVCVVQQRACDS